MRKPLPADFQKFHAPGDLRHFLTTDDAKSIQAARELWDQHSGARGMLDAVPASSAPRPGWTWDDTVGVFRRPRTGRVVTDRELRNCVLRVSNHTKNELKKQTQQLIAGSIILAVWYARTRDLMKALYKTIWLVSIGGFLFDDDVARNLFYAFMLAQFKYLDGFVEQVDDGLQGLDGSAVNRAGMYGSAGNVLFQNIRLENAIRDGYREGRRVLGENENHCHKTEVRPGCIEEADKGWMPIEDLLPIGEATCYSNCLCTLEFRR